jgi:hypothetical protein
MNRDNLREIQQLLREVKDGLEKAMTIFDKYLDESERSNTTSSS